jgi:hypothetical protein
VPSYYPQSFQPMGGKGGFQFQPQFRSQELPTTSAYTTVSTNQIFSVTDNKFRVACLHSTNPNHVADITARDCRKGRKNEFGVKHAYVCTRSNSIPGHYRKRLMKAPQKSLKDWTQQKWRTKSGKPSTQGPKATGERYLPEAAIKSLSSAEYAASTRAKRAGKAAGKQFVAQPKRIAQKTARHRKRLIG